MSPLGSVEKRLPWSFFGFLLGTVSLGIAIGFFYLSKQGNVTDLRFHVDDEFPLVELKDKFPGIKVLFNDEDILESERVIKILRLRLSNEGQTILQSFYDQKLPFGLSFQKSRIIAVSPISPSTGYLRDSLFRDADPSEFALGRLRFNKPIVEKGAEASFKIHLLQDKGLGSTKIAAFGKISGLAEIPVVPFEASTATRNKARRSTGEVVGIGLAAGYGGMFALAMTLFAISQYLEHREKRAREKCCRKFLETNDKITDQQKRMIQFYAEGWPSYWLRTIQALVKGGKVMDLSELVQRQISGWRVRMLLPFALSKVRRMLPLRWDPSVFTVSDSKISLNENNKEVLLKLLRDCNEIDVEPGDAG